MLTLVVVQAVDPTTWLVVTGWSATVGSWAGGDDQGPLDRPDPEPGDLDAELELLDAVTIDYHDRDPSATLRIVVGVEGDDASRLMRIAEARGQMPRDVVAELLRDADRPAM